MQSKFTLFLLFFLFVNKFNGQTIPSKYVDSRNSHKILPIQETDFGIKINGKSSYFIEEEAKREYFVAANFFWNQNYNAAYYWINLAQKNGFESDFLLYMKGVCEMENKEYQKAIPSFSLCINIIKTNSNKDNKITRGKNIFYEKNGYLINIPSIQKIKPNGDTAEYYDVKNHEILENNNTEIILDSIIYGGKFLETFDYSTYPINQYETYFKRAESKFRLQDYFGAINDIQQYHYLAKDSTGYSCYIYAFSAHSLEKHKLAKKYYSAALKLKNDLNDQAIIDCYINRGIILLDEGFKNQACLDWSTAGELGYEKAFEYIKKYCNGN